MSASKPAKFSVRDERKPNHHWADNEVIDDFGVKIGPFGYSVYMYICRHAGNRDGRCYKSQREIAKAFGISTDSVGRGIQELIGQSLVAKEDLPGKPSVYVVLEVPKRHARPTAHSGNQLPPTADDLPLPADHLPPTAARNKEVKLIQDSNQDLDTVVPPSAGPKDEQALLMLDHLKAYWEFLNPTTQFHLGGDGAKNFWDWRKAHSEFTAEQFRQCLHNRALAAKLPRNPINKAEKICRWIGRIHESLDVVLDSFWQPAQVTITNGKGSNGKSEEIRNNLAETLRRRAARNVAGSEVSHHAVGVSG